MAKKYPEQVAIDNMQFRKSPSELYLELQPQAGKDEVAKYLDEHKVLVQSEPKPTDRRCVTIRKFNKMSIRSKWLTRTAGRKENIDALIEQFEKDKPTLLVSPVYSRTDLNYPNGFAFSDQIIIRIEDRAAPKELEKVFHDLGVARVEGAKGNLGKGMMLLRLVDSKKQNVHEVAQQLAKQKLIESAHVDMVQLHQAVAAVPNDTYLPSQWNLRNVGQTMSDGNVATAGCDIDVEPAWDISKGSPLVVIAVLDTGFDLSHPDLLPHFVQPERWYDAVTGTNTPNDDYGHGTCCAGIAAALTDSLTGQGIAGVGWNCRILPIRMMSGGSILYESRVLNALNHVLTHHVNVVSMSWKWDGVHSNIDVRLQDCFDAGIVLVAASGNDAPTHPDSIRYPASNPNVIAVGATNENDRRCKGGLNQDWGNPLQGSQYGPQLSVVAPGVHTWATDMRGTGFGYNNVQGGGDPAGDYFEDFGGTSGATPHVAGLAGLILAYNPTLTPAQVRAVIENTADDLVGDPAEDVAGWDKFMGHGRINAHAALVETQTNHPFNPVDVFIRDSLADTGAEPNTGGGLSASPDIIVRKTAVANPQVDFANMSVDPGSDKVEIGNDNFVYIRVHNKGAAAANIHARIYFANLFTTCGPDLWQYLGQLDFYNVPAGASAVSDALVWKNVPDPGTVPHYCLIASIEGPRDPHPDPTGISSGTQYMQFMQAHNNICYRNLTFENVLPDTALPLNFFIGGFAAQDKFDLRIVKEGLARRANVNVKLARSMFKSPKIQLEDAVERLERPLKGFHLFELKKGDAQPAIKGFTPARRELAQLEFFVPQDAKPGEEYRLIVQQVLKEQVIGAFQIAGKVLDRTQTRFIAVRGTHLVHKADCKCLTDANKRAWVPFESLDAARNAGYDMALDCLKQPFTGKDISRRLERRVLNFVNEVELAEDLNKAVAQVLGEGYFDARYGKEEARKRGHSIGIDVATNILEARDRVMRFSKLPQIETVKGLSPDRFVDLVNAFK